MEDRDQKPYTEEEKRKFIKNIKKQIQNFPRIRKNDPFQTEKLANLRITLAYLYSEIPEFYDDALTEFMEALRLLEKIGAENLKISMLKGSIASVCYAKKDLVNAAEFYKQSFQDLSEVHKTEIMVSKKGYGLSLIGLGKDEEGINQLLDAAEMCVDTNDINNYMDIITMLKTYYAKHEQWEMMIELELKALKILESIENNYEIAMSNLELGLAYSKLKQFEKSLFHFKKTVNFALDSEDNSLIYQGLIMVAETYFNMREFQKAREEYIKSLSLASFMNNRNEIEKTSLILKTMGASAVEIDRAIKEGEKERKKPKRIKT